MQGTKAKKGGSAVVTAQAFRADPIAVVRQAKDVSHVVVRGDGGGCMVIVKQHQALKKPA